jgi:hypothetical protein
MSAPDAASGSNWNPAIAASSAHVLIDRAHRGTQNEFQ